MMVCIVNEISSNCFQGTLLNIVLYQLLNSFVNSIWVVKKLAEISFIIWPNFYY